MQELMCFSACLYTVYQYTESFAFLEITMKGYSPITPPLNLPQNLIKNYFQRLAKSKRKEKELMKDKEKHNDNYT